jgi:exonuclease SbcD
VYDKAQPSSTAVSLLDDFLGRLLQCGCKVLVIPGNHDSPERLAFGASIFRHQGLHIAGSFAGRPEIVTLQDEAGEVDFVLLPFLRPAMVRPFAESEEINTAAAAVKFALSQIDYRPGRRYVLLTHQFAVAGGSLPQQSESETIYAGGIEAVDISLFEPFSYVALGHLHKPQYMGKDHIRYAGSPLKYSFSENKPDKTLLQIDLPGTGDAVCTEHPLRPLYDLRVLRGAFAELMAEGAKLLTADDRARFDYLKVVLTDDDVLVDPLPNLRQYYPHIMQMQLEKIGYDSTEVAREIDGDDLISTTPAEMFARFYASRTGQEFKQEEIKIMQRLDIKGSHELRGAKQ